MAKARKRRTRMGKVRSIKEIEGNLCPQCLKDMERYQSLPRKKYKMYLLLKERVCQKHLRRIQEEEMKK